MINRLIAELKNDREFARQIVYHHKVPPKKAETMNLQGDRLPELLRKSLNDSGIKVLYKHQAQAITAVRAGKNIVVTTPTASGINLAQAVFR